MKSKFFYFIINCLILSNLFSLEQSNANSILSTVSTRLEGKDYSFNLQIFKKKRSKKADFRVFKIWVHWPSNSDIYKMSLVKTVLPENLKDVNYLEHRFQNSKLDKRWMTLPITKQIKDVSNKKISKNEFDFSEIEINHSIIDNSTNVIIEEFFFNEHDVWIIKSTNKNKSYKKFWIDKVDFFIHKIEFYSRRDKLIKIIEFGDLFDFNNIIIPLGIYVNDIKKSTTYNLKIDQFLFNSITDLKIFDLEMIKD